MEYRSFGKKSDKISEIGHGTWTMGGMWGPRDDREAIDSLIRGLDKGINFIDTAFVYGDGHSESLIASALKESKKEAFIATKVPPKNHRWPGKAEYKIQDTFPRDHILEYTEKSLKNLRRDCVDLQQLHVWHDNWFEFQDEWLEAAKTLKESGKIRYFGVSINDHDPNSALKMVESGYVDCVQVIHNIFDQSPEDSLYPLCRKMGVAVIARVPFDEGSLAGALTPGMEFNKKDWRRLYFTPDRLAETLRRLEPIRAIADKEGLTLPTLALKYCLSDPAVTTVIPGMKSKNHVAENTTASDGKPLSAWALAELKKHRWPRNFYPFC